MKQSNAAKSEHDDIQLLLPWYLNKSLSEIESVRVRQHVNSCAICQEDKDLLGAMLEAAVPANVESDASDARLTRVINRIDAYEANQKFNTASEPGFLHGLIAQTKRLLQPTQFIPAAALAVLAAVLVMQFMFDPTQKTYEVRSSDQFVSTQLELQVELTDALQQAEIRTLLQSAGIGYTWRSQSDTVIVITLPGDVPAGELFGLIGRLEEQNGVSSVETAIPTE